MEVRAGMSDDPSHPMYHRLYFGREVVNRINAVSIIQLVWYRWDFATKKKVVASREPHFYASGFWFPAQTLAEKFVQDHPPVKGDGTIPLP